MPHRAASWPFLLLVCGWESNCRQQSSTRTRLMLKSGNETEEEIESTEYHDARFVRDEKAAAVRSSYVVRRTPAFLDKMCRGWCTFSPPTQFRDCCCDARATISMQPRVSRTDHAS